MRALDVLVAFHFLGADVQEPDRRPLDMKNGARHRGTHQRIIGKLLGRRADVGADVENDAFRLDRRPQGRDRRPFDTGHRPQHEFRDRHERAGIARRNRGIGVARLHRFERQPHARAFAAAQCLARLFVHRDDEIGMDDTRLGCECRILLQYRFDAGLLAEKNEPQRWLTIKRQRRPGDHDLRAVVSAHCVECDRFWARHPCRLPLKSAFGATRRARAGA